MLFSFDRDCFSLRRDTLGTKDRLNSNITSIYTIQQNTNFTFTSWPNMCMIMYSATETLGLNIRNRVAALVSTRDTRK